MSKSPFSTEYLLGPHHGCFVGYSTDASVRENAASGGVVSAITRYLLDKNIVKGVMASRQKVVNGQLHPETIVARKAADLSKCKNSIYFDFNPGGQKRFQNLIKELENPGRLAVVGLFCQLRILHRMMEHRGLSPDRIIKIGLFCSHAPDKVLIHEVLKRVGADLHKAAAYHTKTGGGGRNMRVHGTSTIEYTDGTKFVFPLIKFMAYKNAWFYTHKKCLVCSDQFAENADISCGDAWYKEIRTHPIRHTTAIARSPEMRKLLIHMVRDGYLELSTVDPASVVYSQKKVTGVAKASITARIRIAPMFGMKLPKVEGHSRLVDYIHSFLILCNVKISQSRRLRRLIFLPPTKLMLGYVAVIKLLEKQSLPGLPKGLGVGDRVSGNDETDVGP